MKSSAKKAASAKAILTVRQLIAAYPAFAALSKTAPPGLVSFRMAVLIAKLQPELTEAVKNHIEVYKKYWEEDAKGNITPDPTEKPKFASFEKELTEYLDGKVEVDLPKRLPQAWFEHITGVSPEQIIALIPFMETESEETK